MVSPFITVFLDFSVISGFFIILITLSYTVTHQKTSCYPFYSLTDKTVNILSRDFIKNEVSLLMYMEEKIVQFYLSWKQIPTLMLLFKIKVLPSKFFRIFQQILNTYKMSKCPQTNEYYGKKQNVLASIELALQHPLQFCLWSFF